ncbi:MAG TPA: ankyrin repeat domain-containing protein [Thermoanaerobaculia bacterium]|jgi:ankyrin repeat protein|nr:ankyrin repeat domain-containing protein [Thermoanaerobaculia bacterium]
MRRAVRILGGLAIGLALVAAALVALAFFRRAEPRTPLAKAAAAGDSAEVKTLLESGAPPESAGEPWSALTWAARAGREDSLRSLIDAGADPDRRDGGPNGWTPLIHAVHKNQADAVRVLIEAGADVNRAAPNGLTPLMLAAAQGEGEIVELLLDAGADPHVRSGGMTALHHAVLGGDARSIAALEQRAPDVRFGDGWRDRAILGFARLRERSTLVARLDRVLKGVQ